MPLCLASTHKSFHCKVSVQYSLHTVNRMIYIYISIFIFLKNRERQSCIQMKPFAKLYIHSQRQSVLYLWCIIRTYLVSFIQLVWQRGRETTRTQHLTGKRYIWSDKLIRCTQTHSHKWKIKSEKRQEDENREKTSQTMIENMVLIQPYYVFLI